MKKQIPTFKTDEEAEHFVDTADLSEYDLSGQIVRFELRRKDKSVSLRLPESLLDEVRVMHEDEFSPQPSCQEHDVTAERWLREEVAPVYDVMVADPTRAVRLDKVRARLQTHHAERLKGGPQ